VNMPPASPANTKNVTLDEVLARLANHPDVAGIMTFGSLSAGLLSPSSDYDILVIVEKRPVPLWQVLTTIDNRLAEVFFH